MHHGIVSAAEQCRELTAGLPSRQLITPVVRSRSVTSPPSAAPSATRSHADLSRWGWPRLAPPPQVRKPVSALLRARLRIQPRPRERSPTLRIRTLPLERASLRGVLSAPSSVPRINVVAVSLPPRTRRNDMALATPRVEPVARPRVRTEVTLPFPLTATSAPALAVEPFTHRPTSAFRREVRGCRPRSTRLR